MKLHMNNTSKTHVTTCEEQVEELLNDLIGTTHTRADIRKTKQALQKAYTAGLMQEAEHTAGYIKDAREGVLDDLCSACELHGVPYKTAKAIYVSLSLTDNCFKCGKEVPKPEGSPKDRKRWVDKCEECKNK